MADQELTGLSESRSTKIIEAIADLEGVDPTELREPLYGAIDPEALDVLVGSGDVSVTFTYHGYEVTVANGHEPEIEPRRGA